MDGICCIKYFFITEVSTTVLSFKSEQEAVLIEEQEAVPIGEQHPVRKLKLQNSVLLTRKDYLYLISQI